MRATFLAQGNNRSIGGIRTTIQRSLIIRIRVLMANQACLYESWKTLCNSRYNFFRTNTSIADCLCFDHGIKIELTKVYIEINNWVGHHSKLPICEKWIDNLYFDKSLNTYITCVICYTVNCENKKFIKGSKSTKINLNRKSKLCLICVFNSFQGLWALTRHSIAFGHK